MRKKRVLCALAAGHGWLGPAWLGPRPEAGPGATLGILRRRDECFPAQLQCPARYSG